MSEYSTSKYVRDDIVRAYAPERDLTDKGRADRAIRMVEAARYYKGLDLLLEDDFEQIRFVALADAIGLKEPQQ